MRTVWDEAKRQATLKERWIDFADVVDFDWRTAQIGPAKLGRDGARMKAVGFLYEDLTAIIHAPLGTEAISIISMRSAVAAHGTSLPVATARTCS